MPRLPYDLVFIQKHPSVAELFVSDAKQFNSLWIEASFAKLLDKWMFAHCLYGGDHGPSHIQVHHHMIAPENLPPRPIWKYFSPLLNTTSPHQLPLPSL